LVDILQEISERCERENVSIYFKKHPALIWWKSPDQRWMLFKVDAYVLTFASLGYFLKNIDQTNVKRKALLTFVWSIFFKKYPRDANVRT
jgi:hypothetical protein